MVLNVGNSRLGIGVFVAGELKHSSRVPLADGSELRRQLAEAWKLLASTQLPAVAGASVNSAAQVEIEAIVAEIWPSSGSVGNWTCPSTCRPTPRPRPAWIAC